MNELKEKVEGIVHVVDPINADYILNDRMFQQTLEAAERFEARGRNDIVENIIVDLTKRAKTFSNQHLTPANVKVGDGVTIKMYSDAHAATVIKKTKTTLTVQRDKATLDPNWKPEIIPGGFAGHCTNQNTQTYTYERDKDGQIYTFRWSQKYNLYRNTKMGLHLFKGRREFYDYNF